MPLTQPSVLPSTSMSFAPSIPPSVRSSIPSPTRPCTRVVGARSTPLGARLPRAREMGETSKWTSQDTNAMPHRWFRHKCCDDPRTDGAECCQRCGERGIMLPGWGLSVVEQMCRYVCLTGLQPFGAHRQEDSTVWKLFESCATCGSSGVVDSEDCTTWKLCGDCSGDGYRLKATTDELNRAVTHLLARFPDARAGEPSKYLRSGTSHMQR
jgi:hypothetical protein